MLFTYVYYDEALKPQNISDVRYTKQTKNNSYLSNSTDLSTTSMGNESNRFPAWTPDTGTNTELMYIRTF
jgi:hypothetical protein